MKQVYGFYGSKMGVLEGYYCSSLFHNCREFPTSNFHTQASHLKGSFPSVDAEVHAEGGSRGESFAAVLAAVRPRLRVRGTAVARYFVAGGGDGSRGVVDQQVLLEGGLGGEALATGLARASQRREPGMRQTVQFEALLRDAAVAAEVAGQLALPASAHALTPRPAAFPADAFNRAIRAHRVRFTWADG